MQKIWYGTELINMLSLLISLEGSLRLCFVFLVALYIIQTWPHSYLGESLKLAVTVFFLVCLNILWLKSIVQTGKADGTCSDSVSGMQKLAGTFTSHNTGRAKRTYQKQDLHGTYRHPNRKLWYCSATHILLNPISLFHFKFFQIRWVTPQFMRSPALVLAHVNKTVSSLPQQL